jgi:hypothetical protein
MGIYRVLELEEALRYACEMMQQAYEIMKDDDSKKWLNAEICLTNAQHNCQQLLPED